MVYCYLGFCRLLGYGCLDRLFGRCGFLCLREEGAVGGPLLELNICEWGIHGVTRRGDVVYKPRSYPIKRGPPRR